MNRIDKKFADLRKNDKKAFIAFITAGYPDIGATCKLIIELAENGADIIELGVPFTDPMADGKIIQEASQAALKKKINLEKIFTAVKRARKVTDVPVCLMTYYNPVFCFGEEKFVKSAKKAGVDGVIIPDLPPDEASSLISFAKKEEFATIFFISPTTTSKRARFIVKAASGFIYFVSLTGVTGARKQLPKELKESVKKVKAMTKKPVCVGFGISTPGQVKQVCSFADGAIIGSAIVKSIRENTGKKDMARKVGNFIRWLKG